MKELKFVDVGEGITEGHVQKWLVNDGDDVKEDQAIVQIETDKAVVNLPAPISGKIKFGAKENTDLKVGDTIAWVGTADELKSTGGAPSAAPQEAKKATAQPQQAPKAPAQKLQPDQPRPKETLATPYVRKLARDLGIDLATIVGTGPDGRILENDIRSSARQEQVQQKPVPKFSEVLEKQHEEEVERMPMSQTRKAIAKNMELSWTIPRATHMDLINATHLYNMVKKEKPNAEKLGVKLSFLPFIIKALIEALKENPRFNASYDHEAQEIIVKKYYNIGLAAEGADGLKVVVVRDADKKSIIQIAKKIQELHEKVVDRTISIDEMRDSTFTITNIGSLGGGFLSVPMINYPEVGILGVHLIRDMPVAVDGKVKVGKVLPFSIVFDHRVVDGADAVTLGNALIKYLEDPEFLEMLG
ncbi:MAG: 2-oxo acid dehydrogenase subunit E2 [Candidatus Micrarchaeota archaeon]|nr:2-oxo acid dehydrogenase subunit E2 [Candidatus Micrarchaeota archaeon]